MATTAALAQEHGGHTVPAAAAPPADAYGTHGSHGDMMTVGVVDHARNGFDPTAMLTDWYTGVVEVLPDGETLRSFIVDAVDKEIEIAPGVFFPAWTYNGRVPGPALRAKEGSGCGLCSATSDRIRTRCTSTASIRRRWTACLAQG